MKERTLTVFGRVVRLGETAAAAERRSSSVPGGVLGSVPHAMSASAARASGAPVGRSPSREPEQRAEQIPWLLSRRGENLRAEKKSVSLLCCVRARAGPARPARSALLGPPPGPLCGPLRAAGARAGGGPGARPGARGPAHEGRGNTEGEGKQNNTEEERRREERGR